MVPASGLVTALDPVLQACDGTWIAHGSGDADHETVDQNDRLRVPPDDPRYTLRRVWLSTAEEEGYYYGFANEGLWPLCHIAHTRPLFRASDWEQYQAVNRKFADAVVEEMAGIEQPVVLVQDYHFALLPRMIKERRPDARVAIFWHIPWPNAEAFGICPWQSELLDGLLGADLIGFHVQAHCNNFQQTVDRTLEAQVDWEHFTVKRQEHVTLVRPFPISVDFDEFKPSSGEAADSESDRVALLNELGVEAIFMGVGVDRVDYTKGILERFLAIERLFERYPAYLRQFVFVQIGAPSRTHIKRYHDLLEEVATEAERINRRFQTAKLEAHHFPESPAQSPEIERYYRAADLCLVTALHDGMNLVAKEFLAARHDEDGVLVLSCFTGAARELRDALIVNPYDIDQTADAIRAALVMDPEEKKATHAAHAEADSRAEYLSLGRRLDRRILRRPGGRIRQDPGKTGDWFFGCVMTEFVTQSREERALDTISELGLQDFFREVAGARQSALVLDYDGTLAGFRQNRDEALPVSGSGPVAEGDHRHRANSRGSYYRAPSS